jgi:tetratricopeptide (TPR) repeat protein
VLVALLTYADTVPGDFVFDDAVIVQGDSRLKGFDLHRIFCENWFGTARGSPNYRPVTLLSFAVNFRISDRPWAFRVVNVILHGAACAAFYLLAREVLASRWAAAGAAALFAALPIHTEAVAGIVGRAEILAALAVFLAWWLALRPREGPGRALAVGLPVLLGTLSKENAAMAVALIPLSALLLGRKIPWWGTGGAAAGIAVSAILYAALFTGAPAATGPPALVDNPLARAGGTARVLNATSHLGRYAFRTALPLHLSGDHSYDQLPVLAPGDAALWLRIAAFAAPLVLVGFLARRRLALALGPAVFLVSFAPTANVLFPIGTVFAERLAYLPSAGWPLLLAAGLEAACGPRPGARRLAVALLAALTVAYGARSFARNLDWSDAARFDIRLAIDSPRSTRAHQKAAEGWVLRSRRARSDAERAEALRRAEAEVAEALRIYPENAGARSFRALILVETGRYPEALKALEEAEKAYAVERVEKDSDLHYLRAETLFNLGRPAEAREALDRYLERRGPVPKAYNLRALCRGGLGDAAGALSDLDEAIRLEPRNAVSRMNRGIILAESGKREEARRDFDAAVNLDPENPEIYKNRGYLRFLEGDLAGALEDYQRGLRAAAAKGLLVSGPDSVLAFRKRLFDALHRSGRNEEARAQLEAIRALPGPAAKEAARELGKEVDG